MRKAMREKERWNTSWEEDNSACSNSAMCVCAWVCLFVWLCESSIATWRLIAIKICFSELYTHCTKCARLTYQYCVSSTKCSFLLHTYSRHYFLSFYTRAQSAREREWDTLNPFCCWNVYIAFVYEPCSFFFFGLQFYQALPAIIVHIHTI